MKAALVILVIIVALLSFTLIIPIFAKSQETARITEVKADGTCQDFTVTITGEGLGESCWDVKLDIPGRLYYESEGKWKSSFFYKENAICYPDTHASIGVQLEVTEPLIQATAKLRQGSRTIVHDFTINQSCPRPLPDYWTLLVGMIIILTFGWSLAWWWKRNK
jgi:hypothetical protein